MAPISGQRGAGLAIAHSANVHGCVWSSVGPQDWWRGYWVGGSSRGSLRSAWVAAHVRQPRRIRHWLHSVPALDALGHLVGNL